MLFRAAPVNRPTRILAGVVLLAIGGAGLAAPAPISWISWVICGTGLVVAAWASIGMVREWRRPSDRYDLSKLWDDLPKPAEKPDDASDGVPDAAPDDLDVVVCHHCGTGMPSSHSVCQVCGNRLGYS